MHAQTWILFKTYVDFLPHNVCSFQKMCHNPIPDENLNNQQKMQLHIFSYFFQIKLYLGHTKNIFSYGPFIYFIHFRKCSLNQPLLFKKYNKATY